MSASHPIRRPQHAIHHRWSDPHEIEDFQFHAVFVVTQLTGISPGRPPLGYLNNKLQHD